MSLFGRRGRPATEEKLALVDDLLKSLHGSFQDLVRRRRGDRLTGVPEPELFSGRVWTGRQAAKIGVVDEISDMRSALIAKFGPQVSGWALSVFSKR